MHAIRAFTQMCFDYCEDGTMVIDPWVQAAIRFQYDLQIDRSMQFTQACPIGW
jgi:hypothetical protein